MANPLDIILRLQANTTGFNSGMDAAKSATLALTAALAAIGLGMSAKEFIDLSDATQQMNTRIRGATESVEDYNKVQSRLLELANATYRPLEEAQEVYLATSGAMKALGYSTEEILSTTESLSLAFTRNGTAADVAQSAQDALTGALVKGRVDADAWSSIMKATPNIAEDLAKQTGKTTAEILKLGASGGVAVRDLTDTLIVTRDANLAFANSMDTSTKDAIQVVRNGIRALVSDLNEQYNISSRLAEVIQSLGGDMSWITVLFDDAMSAIEALSDRFNSIDPSVFESLKQAVSAAYDAVKELAIGLYELGGVIDDAVMDSINNALSVLSSFAGGVTESGEQVGFLTRIGQGLSVTFGAISDVIYAARIAITQTAATFYDLAAAANRAAAALSFGDASKQFAANADAMSAKAESYYGKAQDLANNWEFQTIKQLDRAVESEADKNARILVENKKALDELLALGEEEGVNNEKLQSRKLSAIQKYAQDAVAANGGVLDSTLELELATKGYFVTVDKDGKAAVTRLTEQEQATAAATIEVKKQEVAFDQAAETGKAFGLDIEAATNKVSAGFNDTGSKLTALAGQLKAAGVDGEIAGEQIYKAWLKWLSQAKSTAEIDLAKQKLMELGVSGQVTGEQLNAGFKLAEKAASDLNPALTAARLAGKQLGIDIDKTSNVMSAGFAANIEKLGALSKKLNDTGIAGQDAANTVYAGWQAVLAQADSPVELEALKIKLQELGNKGELSAKQVEMGLIDVERKLADVGAAVDPVEAAFERLGIKTKEQLRLAAQASIADFNTMLASGKATADGIQKAYERTMQAAIASGDQAVIGQAKAQASAAGLTVAIDATGKVSTKTYAEIVSGADKTTKSVDRISNSFDRAGQSGVHAAQATSEAWDNTVTSLLKAAEKLDEITRKQGGTTGSDFLNGGGKDLNKQLNGAGFMAYSSAVAIEEKLIKEANYDPARAKVKAAELMKDQSWAKTDIFNGMGGINQGMLGFGAMTNYDYINKTIADLAKVSNGTTGQPAKNVNLKIDMGGVQANIPTTQSGSDQAEALFRHLEDLKKGMY